MPTYTANGFDCNIYEIVLVFIPGFKDNLGEEGNKQDLESSLLKRKTKKGVRNYVWKRI